MMILRKIEIIKCKFKLSLIRNSYLNKSLNYKTPIQKLNEGFHDKI